ncbi:PorP/SprF family type IX secretion system membrane protein [uncultured Eudoraea sp.]|uniref:PorP/SprF family type IX secretion system membrane protein n=1 Tax=uncultured Eudoraea sp. TaxID=1035614 RepID=UPI00261A7253|nr:PorP/SprF family type IX secretion system membrane protein [uncultured Eudoraea sp.]
MNCNTTNIKKVFVLKVFCLILCIQASYGQEAISDLSTNTAYHNQLFFNRFLINPTFSLVRENKSYLNILHRNQYAAFEDNNQNYYLGFSNKFNEHTALGIGVYSQRIGVIQEFGFNANYATSVQLGSKSKLTFGTNVTYYSLGLDKNRVVATENDPQILEAKLENKIAIQPGITFSYGNFDVGIYAEDLIRYSQTTNEFLTSFNTKTVKTSLQYTHAFMTKYGLFANARLMPLVQLGQNIDGSLSYVGSVILELPKYGWFQSTLDDTYGMSIGLGFNLSKKLSLGYLVEKNVLDQDAAFGWNHELSLAYTFKNQPSALGGYVVKSEENRIDEIVQNYEEQLAQLKENQTKDKKNQIDELTRKYEAQIAKLTSAQTEANGDKKKSSAGKNKDLKNTPQTTLVAYTIEKEEDPNTLAYQNRLILDELILRQDSIENARNSQFEKKFEMIVRILRSDVENSIKSNLQDFNNPENTVMVSNDREFKTTNNLELKTSNNSLSEAERKEYIKLPIKISNLTDVGVKSGYYVIANVYKNKKYLNAFMNQLNEQGLNAKQFYNKKNGLYYVYLADFKVKEEAEIAYVSDLNGRYNDEKWIMQVDNPPATADLMYED